MKKLYKPLKVALGILCLATMKLGAQTYCSVVAGAPTIDDDIANFTFGPLNNSSPCNFLAPGPGSVAGGYSNYTGLTPQNFVQTFNYPMSAQEIDCTSSTWSGAFSVFIDYNHNGSFSDTGENVWVSGSQTPACITPCTSTFNLAGGVTIPATSSLGLTYVRVIQNEGSAITNPCSSPTWGEVEDYVINILPNIPCSGNPPLTSVIAPTYQVCQNSNSNLSFASTYTNTGFSYQWQSSTVSPVGPWTAISGATNTAFTTTNTATQYYSAIVTCANGGGTTQITSGQVVIANTTTNNVPYTENFEGVAYNGMLPNCSWLVSNTVSISTYTTAQAGYMFGQNSNRFLSFAGNSTGAKYAYASGVQLYPGVTYSAAAWYLTEYSGLTNFTDFSLMLGTAQSSTGLVSLASTNGAAVASQYSLLSNTFVVTTPGIYYLAMRVTNTAASDHLSVDNISITAPCSLNSPTLAVSGLTTVCLGNPVNLTVSGADTYTWSNNGSNNSTISYPTTQAGVINFAVAGTNSLSSCTTNLVKPVNILAGPIVSAFMNDPNNSVCPGQTAVLYAVGSAVGYTWSTTGLAGANTTISPTAPTSYTVLGSNATNCITSATIGVSLYTAPNVGGTASKQTICVGESVVLTATDPSLTYVWISNSAVLNGNSVTAYPTQPTNYQLMGTDANGCTATALISVNVTACTGISNVTASSSNINVYPNPNNGEFTVELNNNTVKSIEVTDVTGRVLISNADPKGTVSFNIAHLSNGIYYVRVQSSEKVDVIKVVKQ